MTATAPAGQAAIVAGSVLIGVVAMEGVAWFTHRFLMHGPLWCWHRSHHEPARRGLELNDLFALVFAGLSIGVFALAAWRHLPWAWGLAAGMTAYGALYALAHDGLVHGRLPVPLRPRRGYLLRLVQAHHLHHRTRTREGAVAFGFLWPGDPQRHARRLAELRGPAD